MASWSTVPQRQTVTHRQPATSPWSTPCRTQSLARASGPPPSTDVTAGNYDTDRLIEVLEGLRRFLGEEKATLLWDGLPSHRSTAMRNW